jgi:hypothetical protein
MANMTGGAPDGGVVSQTTSGGSGSGWDLPGPAQDDAPSRPSSNLDAWGLQIDPTPTPTPTPALLLPPSAATPASPVPSGSGRSSSVSSSTGLEGVRKASTVQRPGSSNTPHLDPLTSPKGTPLLVKVQTRLPAEARRPNW